MGAAGSEIPLWKIKIDIFGIKNVNLIGLRNVEMETKFTSPAKSKWLRVTKIYSKLQQVLNHQLQ